MMCKPSEHLIEYIENQNLEVQSIIGSLPEELPIRNTMKEKDSAEVISTEPKLVPLSTNTVDKVISSQPTINPVPLTPTIRPIESNAPSTVLKLEE